MPLGIHIGILLKKIGMKNLNKVGNLGPKAHYLSNPNLTTDTSQLDALEALNDIYLQFEQGIPKNKSIKGVYLWGKVGRGKTCLMDIFYHSMQSNQVLWPCFLI